MPLHRTFFAAFVALSLTACNFSLDKTPGASEQAVGAKDTAHGQQPAAVTRVDLRKTPVLWDKISSQGLNARAFALSAGEEFTPLRTIVTDDGLVHTRTQQTYQGVPIWGEQVVTTSDERGQIVRMHGNLIQGLGNAKLDVTPAFGPEQALANMKSLHSASHGGMQLEYNNESSDLVIYLDHGRPLLSYVVSFFADSIEGGEPARPTFLVDAHNGDILFQFDGLTTAEIGTGPGGNGNTGLYEYGTDFGYLDVAVSGSTCTMNNAYVKTINLNHGTWGSTAYSYTCPRNTVKQINGAYSPLNDAHFFATVVYRMYVDWIGVPPLPFQVSMRVHYSYNYENAFWDGSSMTVGDGGTAFYPLVVLEIIAHEISHGFTEYNSGLVYSGQSGAISESFSDIAGEAAESYMYGTNDFLVGAQIFKFSSAPRSMCHPPQDGSSIDNAADYYSGLDVHYASGVFNKAACLLAKTPGWNMRMVFQVFARANQAYWTANATYDTAYQGVKDAAADLGFNTADVDAAFAAVGVPGGGGGGASCEGYCDTRSADGCWCDSLCSSYGDCCPDYDPVCNGGSTCTPYSNSLPGISGGRNYYPQDVTDPGCSTLTISIAGGTGNADLYVKFGSNPTTADFDCGPYLSDNNETCTINNPQQGTYYIMIDDRTAYSGVTLSASYQ